jgi:hypothetical protein
MRLRATDYIWLGHFNYACCIFQGFRALNGTLGTLVPSALKILKKKKKKKKEEEERTLTNLGRMSLLALFCIVSPCAVLAYLVFSLPCRSFLGILLPCSNLCGHFLHSLVLF